MTAFIDRLTGRVADDDRARDSAADQADKRASIAASESSESTLPLRYPGKVAVDGERIAISDSGNNRVIVGRLEGKSIRVELLVGGERGFVDGQTAAFDSPQGLTFHGNTLFVADAENHAIRAIDLMSGVTRTVAGTGNQLRTVQDRNEGALSSPWDVTVVDGRIYVAMAGVHQLWEIDAATGSGRVYAGSGGEDIRDGPREEALLAQPMGITRGEQRLYFSDSESSAIRCCATRTGEVDTIVGTGLFDFGDVDGVGDKVRLQHPQGIATAPDGRLLIADSYNDSLKWIDAESRTSTRWIGGLNEPGGVACGADCAYVADTNAHRIMAVDYTTAKVTSLELS